METNVHSSQDVTGPLLVVPPLVDLMRRFVAQRRIENGQTQDDLAAAAGVSKGLVSMLEGGRLKGPPKTASLVKLGQGLKVDPEILIKLAQGIEDQTVMDDGGVLKPLPPNLPPHLQALGRSLFRPLLEGEALRIRRPRGTKATALADDETAAGGEAMPGDGNSSSEPDAEAKPPVSSPPPASDYYVEMPFFGYVGCGRFLHLDDYPIEFRSVPAELARSGDGLVEAVGDSMTGAGIHPGMTLVVKAQRTADNNAVVLVHIPYLGTAVRRLKVSQGSAFLVAQGPTEYPTIRVEGDVRIVGRVKHAYSVLSFE